MIPRIIPCLLLKGGGFVKTVRFDQPTYLGDPINIVKIFNEKDVDELVILDILASRHGTPPAFTFLEQVVSEAFMPVGYGGGVRCLEDARALFRLGLEKVILNTAAVERPELVRELAREFGSQSVVVAIDVRRNFWGTPKVVARGGTIVTSLEVVAWAKQVESHGAGEILLTAVDRDGTMSGYDLELTRSVAGSVGIPVIASGGARSIQDLKAAVVEGEASAAAAGSLFVFQMPHRAVLISYPKYGDLKALFQERE
ncbi:MAG: imidazole glycerol phosphate synthase subunit HisF [Candidatus Riflebacteria bacterium]|nr:imidazole glycerol phosphate synthase subunit HisF [Candidatus Riflebacteria bacterium]